MHQVWCAAYDSDEPSMDGVPRVVRMAEVPLATAEKHLEIMQDRSVRAPKRNLRIETRFVSEWEVYS